MLLCGGAGSRLWPLSRQDAPKQLLALTGETTLLQQTAQRALDPDLFEPLIVIASAGHRFMVEEQLGAIGAARATIVLEPAPRNTAAAAAVAALLVARSQPDGLMLLMPSDHLISDPEAFRAAVREAAETAAGGAITLFGIRPASAATGYGYIRVGEPFAPGRPARRVTGFVEKPSREAAGTYAASGEHLWNSGIFLMSAATLLAELQAHEPALLAAARSALERAEGDCNCLRLDAQAFARCRAISLDRAVMERTANAVVLPVDFSWTDVGSWSALWSITERDSTENVIIGDALAWATHNSYVRSEGPLVVTLGVDDLIVIATKDAVLVAHKDRDQEVREIVEKLSAAKGECL